MSWPFLLVAPALGAGFAVAIVPGHFHATKELLENVGLAVPTFATLVAAGRYVASREPFFAWAALLAANFAARELDAPGYTDLVYVVFAAIVALAWWQYDRLEPYLSTRVVLTGLACTFWTYILTATLDLRWWRFLPYEAIFEERLEETLEIVGHAQLLLTMLLARRAR